MADKSNEVDIKIKADGNTAIVTISKVKDSVRSIASTALNVSRSIGQALSVFSRLNWIVSSLQLVVEGVKKLREWMNRAATAARELADQLERDSIATSAALAAEAYKKLNKELAEANRLEKERNAILDQRKATARDLEDANLERDKQMEIAKLDTSSATYQEDKAAIERKYARRASEVATARADEDSRAGARRLYAEADRKDRDAAALQKEYDRETRIAERSRDRVWKLGMAERRGVEGAKEKHEEAEQQWKRDEEAAQKTKEAMEALRKEAESIRARAAEMTGGSRTAHIRDEARQRQISNEERSEEARKKKAEDERLTTAKREKEKQDEISKLDPSSPTYSRDVARIERDFRKRELEARLAALDKREPDEPDAPEKPEKPDAPEKPSAERLAIEAELAKLANEERADAAKQTPAERERVAAENRERTEKISMFTRMESAAVSADAVSENRLTAMGLGSGVSAQGNGVANDVRKIIDLLKQEIEATKNIKPGEAKFEE